MRYERHKGKGRKLEDKNEPDSKYKWEVVFEGVIVWMEMQGTQLPAQKRGPVKTRVEKGGHHCNMQIAYLWRAHLCSLHGSGPRPKKGG